MSYTPIQTVWEEGLAGDAHLLDILDSMAAMEKETLGFRGLRYSWGRPPKTLDGAGWPRVLHFLGSPGAAVSAGDFGGVLAGGVVVAGGAAYFTYYVTTAVLVGPITGDIVQLQAEALEWLLPLHLAYAMNKTLDGRVRLITPGDRPEFRPVVFGGGSWYGMLLYHEVTALYLVPWHA